MNNQSYMDLGPATPYLIRSGNTFVTGDFDGDGRCEVASYSPANNALNILSYFEYSDASSQWSGAPPQMINAWSSPATLPAGAGVTQGWNFQSNDLYMAVNFSGAAAFLVIFNPTSLNFGIAQWTGIQMQLVWFSTGSSAPYCGLNAGDQFFVADVNGDGNDELIQFTQDGQYLFVLQFQPNATPGGAGALNCISSSHNTVGSWTMSSTDLFVPAHLDEGASDQLLVISTLQNSVCVLSYTNGSFTGVPMEPPVAMLGPGLWEAADLDGDGLDEMVTYYIGSCALKWSGTAFTVLANNNFSLPAPAGTVLPIKQNGSADLLMGFCPENAFVFVSGFADSNLTTLWSQQGSIPVNVGLKPTDQFYAADVNGDGNDELVMVSPTDGWLFTIQWSGSQLQNMMSVQGSAPAWGISLLAAAPSTPFAVVPFTGNQLAIYQNISQILYAKVAAELQHDDCSATDIRSCYPYLESADFVTLQTVLNAVPLPDSDTQAVVDTLTNDLVYSYICSSINADCNNDIRSEYTNTTYTNYSSFGILAGRVAELTMPSSPCWTQATWTAMLSQLVAELYGMGSVINWSNSMGYMSLQMQNLQSQALNIALQNVNGSTTAPSDDTKVSSIAIDVLGAIMSGAAAVTGFGEVFAAGPVVLSFGAALFPAVFSALDSGPQQPAPQVPYSEFAAQINEQFGAASNLTAALVKTFSADSILLPLVGGLLNGLPTNKQWLATTEGILAYVNTNLTPTVLQYYSLFIPMRFDFLVWKNTSNTVPYFCKMVHGPNPGWIRVQLSPTPPANSYFTYTNSPGNYTIYLLCNGSLGWLSADPDLSYPSEDLFTDLFTTRGVLPANFFLGQGLWAGIANQNASPEC